MTSDPFGFEVDDTVGRSASPSSDASSKSSTSGVTAAATSSVVGSVRSSSAKRYKKLNDRTAYFIIISAIFAAVPIGLNRPAHWLIWGAICALVVLLYMLLSARYEPQRKLLSAKYPWLFGLALCVPVWSLLQSLQLGASLNDWESYFGWPLSTAPIVGKSISILPSASAMAALRFAFYVLFAVLCIEVSGRTARAYKIGWMVFWGVVAHAVWALIALRALGDVYFWGTKIHYVGSATGTFINRNSFATFLGMGGALGIALALDYGFRTKNALKQASFSDIFLVKCIIWLGVIAIYLCLLATDSRMGLVAGLVGAVLAWFLMSIRTGQSLLRLFGALFALSLVGLVAAFILFDAGTLERTVFLQSALETRLAGYALIKELILARPWVGFGMDSFRPAFELVSGAPDLGNSVWDRAHSTYLTHWSELGLIVGSIPVVLGALVLLRLVRIIGTRRHDFALSVAALAALAVGAIHSLVDFSLEMPANVILLLTIVCLGLVERSDRNQETTL